MKRPARSARAKTGGATRFVGAGPQRLQKILAAAGLASRRGSEEWIRNGRVSVNGRVVELGASADPSCDRIEIDGEALELDALDYWVAHKPRGALTTLRDPEGRPTVMDLLPRDGPRLFPVGRLDRETSGLVLLTNDGELTHRLLHPSHESPREYRVTARGEVSPEAILRLESGIRIERQFTAPAQVRDRRYDPESNTTRFRLVLREGRKRQIRRSLEILGHPVKRLVRVSLGPLRLGRLPVGRARRLDPAELAQLRDHVAGLDPKPRKSRARAKPRR